MSLITIDNLTESRELDSAAAAELRGGMLPLFAGTILMNMRENFVSLADVSFTVAADNGALAQIAGGVTLTNVIGANSLNMLS